MLKDPYGRPLKHLRISVTKKCNYKCIYCHREGEFERSDEMRLEDIMKISRAAFKVGISKVKLTGGEPLIRADILKVVEGLCSIGFSEVSMTTNGFFLEDYAEKLADSGLSRVNVNFPSLRREVYEYITGVDGLEKVLRGVDRALDAGLKPVKLNYVVLRGLNDREFEEMLDYVRGKENLILQVIELEPVGYGLEVFEKYHVSIDVLESMIREVAEKVEFRRDMHYRPQYLVDGALVEFVRSHNNPIFCMHCTRIRVTSNGKLKTCLLRGEPLITVDYESSLEDIVEKILEANSLRRPFYHKD